MRNLYIFMRCALLIGLTSCSDKRQMPNNDIEMGGEGDCGFFYPKIEADIEQTETRTEFNGSGFVLRSKFSKDDQINVLYTDGSAISSATFTAKVENEQVKFVKDNACTQEVWDKIKEGFKLAYVINDNVEYNESDGSLILKYEGQSGSLKDLGKYDFVYTNKDDEFYTYFPYIVKETNGSEVSREVLRLHFRHVQNNILHIPLTSEKFVEGAEMSVDLNFLPLGYDNNDNYKLSGDLFYSKLECANFAKGAKPVVELTPNSVTLNEGKKTERTVNCFHLSGKNLEPKDKRVDLYVVTPASSVVGRMTVRCVLKKDGKKLSQSLLLGNLDNEASESFDRESTILHASANKAFNMDTDNAIGMFLYDDKKGGGYAPLTSNTDNVLGIISTNSVASVFPNNNKGFVPDFKAEYRHYAVGLEIVKINNWWGQKDKIFDLYWHDLKDCVRFPDAYVKEKETNFFELKSDSKCYLNRNGRLYTEMLREKCKPNIKIVGDDNMLENCSKPFIPTSGQIYYTINNLVSVYDGKNFIDVQCTIKPNKLDTEIYGKCSYFISWPGLYYNDRIDTFMKSFAVNGKLNEKENTDYIVCSNMNSLKDGGFMSFYYFRLYTLGTNKTYTLENVSSIQDNENIKFYYIPFYAVK